MNNTEEVLDFHKMNQELFFMRINIIYQNINNL